MSSYVSRQKCRLYTSHTVLSAFSTNNRMARSQNVNTFGAYLCIYTQHNSANLTGLPFQLQHSSFVSLYNLYKHMVLYMCMYSTSNLVLHELLTGIMKSSSPLGDKFVPLFHGMECTESSVSLSKHLLTLVPILTQLPAVLPADDMTENAPS